MEQRGLHNVRGATDGGVGRQDFLINIRYG